MELFFSLYFIGAYITALVFIMLLNIDSFREYIANLLDSTKQLIRMENYHAYALMSSLTIILSLASWLGFIGLIALIIDFFDYLNNNK